MFVRLVTFKFGEGGGPKASALAGDLGPAISDQKGCKGVTFFGDESEGEYGLFVLWESREEADDAATVIGPRLQQHMAGNVQGPPSIRLYEVIEP